VTLIWVHEDAITLDHPVSQAAGPHAQAIFIWDTEEHDRRNYSAKRRVFIYECAQDTGRFFRFWNRAKKSALTHSTNLL